LWAEFHREDFAMAAFWSFASFSAGFGRRNFTARFFRVKFALFAFARALHKILRRSCRDFAPLLRRFLEYKARKFRRRILSKILPYGISPYEISP